MYSKSSLRFLIQGILFLDVITYGNEVHTYNCSKQFTFRRKLLYTIPLPQKKDQKLRICPIPTLHPPRSFQFHFINPLGTPRLVEATKMGLLWERMSLVEYKDSLSTHLPMWWKWINPKPLSWVGFSPKILNWTKTWMLERQKCTRWKWDAPLGCQWPLWWKWCQCTMHILSPLGAMWTRIKLGVKLIWTKLIMHMRVYFAQFKHARCK